jgi:hypothetical protein
MNFLNDPLLPSNSATRITDHSASRSWLAGIHGINKSYLSPQFPLRAGPHVVLLDRNTSYDNLLHAVWTKQSFCVRDNLFPSHCISGE